MVVSTSIVNGTDGNLSLKEGNAGVYRDITVLAARQTHIIQIDPNATYREYAVVSSPTPGGDKVFITSDECIDFSKITISLDEAGKHVSVGQPRVDPKATEPLAEQPPAPLQGPGWFARIFRRNKK